ncbi:hypothetical protein H8L32_23120 [Undibacterium sp. CY18W]|uniref:Uncharacterized protein n=1 Tax=Undibacterium hunanense TaxID=2762292 RepID=A0ABR6ZWY1_9BURK|nr:hypothetical protein [Undibacterium hunanense]MBC3920374.1 hypothetical protein [Undibacterium hunanense]
MISILKNAVSAKAAAYLETMQESDGDAGRGGNNSDHQHNIIKSIVIKG